MPIEFQVNGQPHTVKFNYGFETVPANPDKQNSQPHSKPVSTTCELFHGGQLVGTGNATCHPNTAFTYREGRKWALKFAMTNAGIDRATRTQIWLAMMNYIRK